MLRLVDTSSIGFSVVVTDAVLDLSVPSASMDYESGYIPLQIVQLPNNFTLQSNQTHLARDIVVSGDYSIQGVIITFGTSISGSGEIFGGGEII
jgi:hypothetical protein